MVKSKWFYISLIVLSVIIISLSALTVLIKPSADDTAARPPGFPSIGEMPAGGVPVLPENMDMFEVQRFMEKVEKNGGLTPELEQQAKEIGIPDQMLEIAGTAAPPKRLNIVLSGAMIMGTIVIGFSSFRLYKLKKHK